MTTVKLDFPREELHATLLIGLLLGEVRRAFASEDWNGLRQSHFRVISAVPPEGISVTELGERVGMSKQGCGQFVTSLVQSGHRLLALPLPRQHGRQLRPRVAVLGPQLQQLAVALGRFVEFVQIAQKVGQVVQRVGIVRPQP